MAKSADDAPPFGESKANLISDRLRYALATLGLRQTTLLPYLNDALRHIMPAATPFNAFTLSRTLTGKRPVKDFELLALARALQVNVTWLLGLDPIETLRDDVWKLA